MLLQCHCFNAVSKSAHCIHAHTHCSKGTREYKREGEMEGGEMVEEDRTEIDSQSGKEKYKENTNAISKTSVQHFPEKQRRRCYRDKIQELD